MLRFISLRVTFSAVLAVALLPAAAFAQSQDSQSVAEAARRAREQKKTAAKPARVVTDDDVKPVAPASSESAPAASAQAPSAANLPAAQTPPDSSGAQEPKDEKSLKEIADLKEEIKQALHDLDVLQRQLSLEQDNYFSKPDYSQDTAGKAKVDGVKQQAGDKQQELDRLKARLAELQSSQGVSTTAPPKS